MAEAPAPKAILRGHRAQVHAATFVRHNARLVTGDAEGYVALWDLTIMRPRAVWRAHENAILGVKGWGKDKIITHGRDNKLIVWKVAVEDEDTLSSALPVEDVPVPRPQPWILHLLEVNTMNFCAFAACMLENVAGSNLLGEATSVLIAVPNTLASESIDIYSLPSQSRIHTVKPGQGNGMAMSLALLHKASSLTLIAAFENGFASVHRLETDGQWTMTYRSQAHTQPILSLDVHPDCESFLTSAADATIAKHPIPTARQEIADLTTSSATSSRVGNIPTETSSSLLSAALGQSARPPGSRPSRTKEWEHPLRTTNTKHSGQQSLHIRSDGRIFATAGWDSNLRVYSAKTLKELAVLQWHKVGAYAIAFSDVLASTAMEPQTTGGAINGAESSKSPSGVASHDDDVAKIDTKALTSSRLTVKSRRIRGAQATHWVVGGAKDGKVSLWDIY